MLLISGNEAASERARMLRTMGRDIFHGSGKKDRAPILAHRYRYLHSSTLVLGYITYSSRAVAVLRQRDQSLYDRPPVRSGNFRSAKMGYRCLSNTAVDGLRSLARSVVYSFWYW